MRATETTEGAVRADGVVVRVDPVNRELTVRFGDRVRVVDVPIDCAITLRGERVRFRLVQARDHVRVTGVESPNGWVACAIEVQPGPPSAGPPARFNGTNSPVPAPAGPHSPRPVAGTLATGQ
jgi:hypothetical protein